MGTIIIGVVVDVVAALSDDALADNIYLMDNNKEGGSIREGTASLQTKIAVGDTIQWVVNGMEVETAVNIRSVTGPGAALCKPNKILLQSGGSFWQGVVVDSGRCGSYPYTLVLDVEGRTMSMTVTPSLIF